MGSTTLLLPLFFLATLAPQTTAFNCSTPAPCHALVDYVVPNTTSLNAIKTLFGIKKLYSLLGANNLNISTSPNTRIPAKQKIKIPFPCRCANGSGISDQVPIYVVQPGNGLDYIARNIFSELMKYEDIAAVNGIPDPNKIEVGQKLQIPLPCSCDEVNGTKVVHYGHVVVADSSVGGIAQEFGTTEETLLKLNGMANSSQLLAGQVLDVPLKACSSSVKNESLDSPLLVPNNTYVLTAHQCIKCKCDAANNWILQCEPSQVNSTQWRTCPSPKCTGSDLSFGNTTSSTSCSSETCAYAGYNNQTIMATLSKQDNCSAPNSNDNNSSGASRIGLQVSSWNFLFISVHLVLLVATLALFQ
ncbi:hypothetical protein UlMin_032129 [Ulmus minor]